MALPVVITGAGVISSLGDRPATLHQALLDGRSGLGPITGVEGGGGHGAQVVDFAPEQYLSQDQLKPPLSPMPRVVQLCAAAVGKALDGSGWTLEAREKHQLGLIVGTMFCSVGAIAAFDRKVRKMPLEFANTVINAAAGKAAICHRLTGINSTLAAGLASGLQAIAYAADLIAQGRTKALVAGGAEELSAEGLFALHRSGLSCGAAGEDPYPLPCDRRRNGFAPGEGAAFLVLEEEESARQRGARALGRVEGHASLYDVEGGRDAASARRTLQRTIGLALENAGLEAAQIDAVSAAAHGGPAFDRREAEALAGVFGPAGPPVTAIKAMLGETLGAAGALQAVDLVESMQEGALPGIAGLEQVESDWPLDNLVRESRRIDLRTGLIEAVGYDGHCCALVLSRREEDG